MMPGIWFKITWGEGGKADRGIDETRLVIS